MPDEYLSTLEYLYKNLPMFQRVGAVAYKADLTNTIRLCKALGNPEKSFKSIHIAGTNGKGSSSHMLAAILQCAGYKTGLYTSPHLKEFTERIKINGQDIGKEFVVDFVRRIKPEIEKIQPSFFEITVAMAFDYFAACKVDIAVIETGLGGRLDSTNVITPVLSLITNIGYDHMDILGDTLQKIASEKAGIIKQNVPVVISERQMEVAEVFQNKSKELNAMLSFATNAFELRRNEKSPSFDVFDHNELVFTNLNPELKGRYQRKNIPGVLMSVKNLQDQGYKITKQDIQEGIENVVRLTGLKGRWQKLGDLPMIICDTGHNVDGLKEVVEQIRSQQFNKLFVVLGMVKDKDITSALQVLPKEAYYFFCQASIPRALNASALSDQAVALGLQGEIILNVNNAIKVAKSRAGKNDFIFIGGSTFVVAEIEIL